MSKLADDAHNERMVALVGTAGQGLAPRHETYDMIAVGGGTGGLVASSGAAILGLRVGLIESDLLGGDCLVAGCVPSKALLHAARVAHDARHADAVGVQTTVSIDGKQVMDRVRRIRSEVANDDSVATLTERGVEVIAGRARFTGANTVEVAGKQLTFRRALVATGAKAVVPDIPGLAAVDPLTHESLFELPTLPKRVVVLGGGPIGCEFAQALGRLGSAVTLLQRGPSLLPRDDPEAGAVLQARLQAEGVEVRCGTEAARFSREAGDIVVATTSGGVVRCDRVIVAAGRRAVLDELGLEAAGVEHGPRGIVVDRFQRTSNRRIYAVGDVAVGPQFTHAAWAQAEYATLNALFPVRLDAAARALPHVTYTDPEVAHVGLAPAALAELGARVTTLRTAWHDNDRAHTDDEHHGFAKVHLRGSSDRILAATAVGRGAGELIAEIALAMTTGLGLSKIAKTIHAYPTRSEVWRTLAYEWQTRRVGGFARRAAGWWVSLLR
ncbi:MAG: FAD-dependent oxidoreductase [Myxococcota bacterium]